MTTPVITKMEVYPVAGKDCMELNLSGAHAPYFTRNVVVLYADNGEMFLAAKRLPRPWRNAFRWWKEPGLASIKALC